MTSILQEKHLFLVSSKNFLFFTWKLEVSDTERVIHRKSSNFNLRGDEDWCLEVVSGEYLALSLLHVSQKKAPVKEGHFAIIVSDVKNSVIYSNVESTNFPENNVLLYIFWNILELPTKYPIIITCTSKDSGDCLSKESLITPPELILLNNLRELSSDLKKVVDQNMYSDFVLRVGDDTIKAHKMILQARSPVFHKMFTNDLSEIEENEVEILEIEKATIERFLSYLYTGTVEKCSFEDYLKLYYAADKYQVLSLRDICKMELLHLLQVNNACSLFLLANRHSDDALKKRVVQFISADFKSVVETVSFGDLSKDDMKLLTRLCAPLLKFQSDKK